MRYSAVNKMAVKQFVQQIGFPAAANACDDFDKTVVLPVYQLSAKMGSVPAMNNLGNIAALQKKYEEALSWYKKALEIEPENRTAKSGLNRIQS